MSSTTNLFQNSWHRTFFIPVEVQRFIDRRLNEGTMSELILNIKDFRGRTVRTYPFNLELSFINSIIEQKGVCNSEKELWEELELILELKDKNLVDEHRFIISSELSILLEKNGWKTSYNIERKEWSFTIKDRNI